MNLNHDRIYRKTERGVAALNTRSGTLPARGRTVLILVNGRESLAALMGKVGDDAVALVEMLLGLGLIEELPEPPAPPRPKPTPAPTAPPTVAPAVAVPAATPAAVGPAAQLAALKVEVIVRLTPQFGPDVDVVCKPLLAATTEEAYRSALAAIETKLAIYLGRKGAQRMLDGLRI